MKRLTAKTKDVCKLDPSFGDIAKMPGSGREFVTMVMDVEERADPSFGEHTSVKVRVEPGGRLDGGSTNAAARV